MPNTITAWLENLVAATAGYNAPVVGQTAFIDGVYTAVQSDAGGRNASTITIPFPDFGAFTDIGATDLSDQSLTAGSVVLPFNSHPAASFLIRDFEQWQTAVNIRENYLEPMYMRAAEYLNAQVAALINPTNFNVNPAIAGQTPGEVTVPDSLQAWDLLASQKVPLVNSDDLSLFVHNNNYRRMLGDSQWVQESLVGRGIAEQARTQGALPNAFRFQPRWDQQSPKAVTAIAGTVAIANGSPTVTGTGTAFTNALIGQNIVFGADPTQACYRVTAVASGTSLTVAANYSQASIAGSTATAVQYTCVAMHRYAIALGMRPMPAPDTTKVHYMPILYRGIPLRVIVSYIHRSLGYLVSVDFGFGLKVIRPAFGVILTN